MGFKRSIGFPPDRSPEQQEQLMLFINLKLRNLGCPTLPLQSGTEMMELLKSFLAPQRQNEQFLHHHLCPVDQRIQDFLNEYLKGAGNVPVLPGRTFVLDRHGIARLLSLPHDRDEFVSDIVRTYRVRNGILHNPKSDRRTTKGIFHIVEGGLPIPCDKKAVPKLVFRNLLDHALHPPTKLMQLPITASQASKAECLVSLLLRPMICPAVPGFTSRKTMEIRFLAPGNLVGNLDFIESIFGNAGDPYLFENDAGLDVEHWSGHTGCVILAPHLTGFLKKDLGLPHWDQATERQRSDAMCWKKPDERYNDGEAFKITARDSRGVIVTIISDNYFGYCKKEVKTQISYAANLFGLAEEEHAGGALTFPSYDLAEEFSPSSVIPKGFTFPNALKILKERVDLDPAGFAVDKHFNDIIYIPEDAFFDLRKQTVIWDNEGIPASIKLRYGFTYILPSGYKVHLQKPVGKEPWRLIGTVPEGTLCHKPCTVSGGGKSEISKPITSMLLQGPVFVNDLSGDFDFVQQLLVRDYSNRFRDPSRNGNDHRSILSSERSLGSVIKLFTPSETFSDEYNSWLQNLPHYVKELVFVIKRFHKPEWGGEWKQYFSVDYVNGAPGNELRLNDVKLVEFILRVGFAANDSWRIFALRKDFHPAAKIQMEDDITASVVVGSELVENLPDHVSQTSLKFVENCEFRLFQRPDDAIHRGTDALAELDFSRTDNFFSNYEPLDGDSVRSIVEESISYYQYTQPMQEMIREFVSDGSPAYMVSTAHPRLVDGKPSKNPRYLQTLPDLLYPRERYVAEMGMHLRRKVPLDRTLATPVSAILAGRRNNPSDVDAGIRSLAVYSPIHYMELPELFMEFICSMTGKSPSTTGAGSEGALTKGPFNSLLPIYDLNAALISYVMTGYPGFITSAGWVGPKWRVDHDLSLLVPEIWCRMSPSEKDAKFLIENGYLERCPDIRFENRILPSSRLGYRITSDFVKIFFGRVFHHPHVVFTNDILRPELQDLKEFAEGMDNVVTTQKRVALNYFQDGCVESACPPLKALLHIMAYDHFEGKDLNHPEFRGMFTREHVIQSYWYQARLKAKQNSEVQLAQRHISYLEKQLKSFAYEPQEQSELQAKLKMANEQLSTATSTWYLEKLEGTIGGESAIWDDQWRNSLELGLDL